MKNIIMALTLLSTVSAFANSTVYTNNSGCTVEVEKRNNGVIYYVQQDNKTEVLGVTNDFKQGTFAYCDDSELNINFFQGKKGTGIFLSCSEHHNGNAVTRGRADIDIMAGELTKIVIDGQVKKLMGWKQDTKIDCQNLVRK